MVTGCAVASALLDMLLLWLLVAVAAVVNTAVEVVGGAAAE